MVIGLLGVAEPSPDDCRAVATLRRAADSVNRVSGHPVPWRVVRLLFEGGATRDCDQANAIRERPAELRRNSDRWHGCAILRCPPVINSWRAGRMHVSRGKVRKN